MGLAGDSHTTGSDIRTRTQACAKTRAVSLSVNDDTGATSHPAARLVKTGQSLLYASPGSRCALAEKYSRSLCLMKVQQRSHFEIGRRVASIQHAKNMATA